MAPPDGSDGDFGGLGDDLNLEELERLERRAGELAEKVQAGKGPARALDQEVLRSHKLKIFDERLASGDIPDTPRPKPMATGMAQLHPGQRSDVHRLTYQSLYANGLAQARDIHERVVKGSLPTAIPIRALAGTLVDAFMRDRHLLFALVANQASAPALEEGDYVYRHALNVSILSLALAAFAGYSQAQVAEIAQGALLADVGMALVPEAIRSKKGKLDPAELEEIHKHPLLGLALLEKVSGLSETVFAIVYQHHERLSGAGYPRRRSGAQVCRFARIAGIADTYAAMVLRRAHREAMTPSEALDRVVKMAALGLFDTDLVRHLARGLGPVPVGSLVRMANGRIAKVVAPGDKDGNRPLVSLLADDAGRPMSREKPQVLDLQVASHERISEYLKADAVAHTVLDGF